MSEQPTQPNYERPVEGTPLDHDNVIDFRMARDGLKSYSLIEAQRQIEQSYVVPSGKTVETLSPVAEVHVLLVDLHKHRLEKMAA